MNPSVVRAVFGRFETGVLAICAALLLLAGCAAPTPLGDLAGAPLAPQTLNEGDVIRVNFPTTPTLNSQPPQTVRRDGKINLEIIGEVLVAGKTVAQLEKELNEAYAKEVRNPEIKVTVVSSAFVVYVSGSVMKPGKIVADHALTALDAIMEAGGPTPTADLKEVRVLRLDEGKYKSIKLNMKSVLNGKDSEPFYLKPYDKINVPEKFSWF
jgi:protein involved in polysaccharide export with SLBB domain